MTSLLRRPNVLFYTTLLRHGRSMACFAPTFKHQDLEITRCKESEMAPKPDPDKLLFGKQFADHMFEVEWTSEQGWGKPRICPVHNLDIHPAAKVFHYAAEIFEGLKAYRGYDNKIRLFRPDQNASRMLNSARRAVLPLFSGDELIKCMKQLVSIDKEWVPYSTTSTLYVRPTLIGTEPCLGVSQSQRALLYILTGPVGGYFPKGFQPVSLLADPSYVRATEGGVGAYKMGANYAPTVHTQIEAMKKHGCDQVLWLNGDDHRVAEVGTMNLFMYWINEQGDKELVTPPLSTGVILPGVTRKSLLELCQQWGEFKVSERNFIMKDLTKALEENRLLELFGAGTACVVCPVDKIIYQDKNLHIPTMDDGAPLTMRLFKELTDIQFGRTPSKWVVEVD